MKKRVVILLISLVLVLGNVFSVSAADEIPVPMGEEMMTEEAMAGLLREPSTNSPVPYWMYILSSTENMDITDGIASMYGTANADSGHVNKITAYMYLQKQSSSGGGFSNIASWRLTVDDSDIDMFKQFPLTSRGTYRTYCIYHVYYGTGASDYEVTSGYTQELDY